jgi:hypothetical protein
MPEVIPAVNRFVPDQHGDAVPGEVYDLVAKLIVERGYGDLEIYRVFGALSRAWPESSILD